MSLLVAGAAVVFLWILSFPWLSPEEEILQSPFSSEEPHKGVVSFNAWIDTNRVQVGDVIGIVFTIQNESSTVPVDLELLDLRAPGFRGVGPCWKGGLPACWQGAKRTPHGIVLAPAGRAILKGELTPQGQSGRYELLALFSAKQEGQGAWVAPVRIGPVAVTTHTTEAIRRTAIRAYSTLKDLAVPILGVLIAGLFTVWTKRHEAAEKQRDLDLEAFKAFMTSAQTYYMSLRTWVERLLSRAPAAIDQVRMLGGSPTESLPASREGWDGVRETFYDLVLFLREMTEMREHLGGVILRSLAAEKALAKAWSAFLYHATRRLGRIELRAAIESTPRNQPRPDFQEKAGQQPSLVKVEASLVRWLAASERGSEFKACLPLLEILSQILKFEINRPLLEAWYSVPPREQFPHQHFGKALREMETSGLVEPQETLAELRESLRAYAQEFGMELGQAPTPSAAA